MLKLNVRKTKNLKDQKEKYYLGVAPTTPIKLEDVTTDIERMCTVNSADIKAVLDALQTVIIDRVKSGQSVRLGDLGSFRPTVTCASVEDPSTLKVSQVKAVRCRFTQSGRMSRELDCRKVPMALAGSTTTPPMPASEEYTGDEPIDGPGPDTDPDPLQPGQAA